MFEISKHLAHIKNKKAIQELRNEWENKTKSITNSRRSSKKQLDFFLSSSSYAMFGRNDKDEFFFFKANGWDSW